MAHDLVLPNRGGLVQWRLRLLPKRTHSADIGDRTVADACNAELGEPAIRWRAVHNHDVDGQRDRLGNLPDQRIVHQAGNEEAGCAGRRVGLGSVERFADSLRAVIAMFEKHIRASVDEKIDALLLRRFTNGRNTARLPVEAVKSRTFDDPIFEIDADHAEIQEARDVRGQLTIVFAVAAFEIIKRRNLRTVLCKS